MRILSFAATMSAAAAAKWYHPDPITIDYPTYPTTTPTTPTTHTLNTEYEEALRHANSIMFRTPRWVHNKLFNGDFDLFKYWLTRFEVDETSMYED